MSSQHLPWIFAHRGASGQCHENTIKAFDQALEQGADGIESDIFVSKDGVPFMFHDSWCQLKDQEEKVHPWTLAISELDRIVMPAGERIPTLQEFFDRYRDKTTKAGNPILFSFDLQHLPAGPATAKLTQEYGLENQMYLCAKNTLYFAAVRRFSKKIHLVASNAYSWLTQHTADWALSPFTQFRIEIFNIKAADFKAIYLTQLTKQQFQFFIWDLHTEEKLRQYLPYRPQGIYSNFPDLAVRIRNELFT
jgi:glycerophosphoryl diester phosphodiesterase